MKKKNPVSSTQQQQQFVIFNYLQIMADSIFFVYSAKTCENKDTFAETALVNFSTNDTTLISTNKTDTV